MSAAPVELPLRALTLPFRQAQGPIACSTRRRWPWPSSVPAKLGPLLGRLGTWLTAWYASRRLGSGQPATSRRACPPHRVF